MRTGTLLFCSVLAALAADTQVAAPANSSTSQKLWSYQPVKRPEIPGVQQQSWVLNSD